MGGRGTYAAGNPAKVNYKTVGYIHNVPVVEGINGKHSLPEENHKSWAYIRMKNGIFYEMRIYDEDHYLVLEIAYHPESGLNPNNPQQPILHIHEYKRDNWIDRPARKLTKEEYLKYKKYFVGVPEVNYD